MPIVGNGDERIRILNFDDNNEVVNKPLPSITAIDTRFIGEIDNSFPDFGTGIVISPNFVLTAAHVIYLKAPFDGFNNRIRVSSSNNQKVLNSRVVGINNRDPGTNVNNQVTNVNGNGLFLPFFDDYVAAERNTDNENRFDIGLIELNNTDLISDAPPVGLTAFVDPRTVRELGIPIQTAGYAGDNVANSYPPDLVPNDPIPDNSGIPDQNGDIRPRAEIDNVANRFQVQTRDLVLAPGILDANGNETTGTVFNVQGRRIQYSDNIDTVGGQSGSPVWHTLEGDDPRVLAVHSRGGGFRNAGTLIDIEAYNLIMDEIEGDEDPALLPENLIYGSDPISRPIPLPDLPGDDQIEGTYRKERILGLAGNDTIFGAGADDRLEGNEGDDNLDGGPGDDRITGGRDNDLIDGGTNTLAIINPFNRENDVAVYSANRSEYTIETETIGGIGIIGIGEETVTTVTHLNGNGDDGTDTLTNIEFLEFADGAIPLLSDDDILDDLLNFFGGSGNDNIVGNILDNVLRGEGGNDLLSGRDGDDTLKGNSGNDKLFGEDDNDLLQGFIGSDILEGGAGNDRMYGNEGSDIFRGGSGNDILSGGAGFGRDKLKGQNGNDSIAGGGGNDLLQGGNDNDTLLGNGNNDILFGDDGNDRLDGGEGRDTLSGGAGQDEFVFVSSSQSQDEIRDFKIQDDTLLFQASKFAGISTLGMITSDMLTIGSSAKDSSDRFLMQSLQVGKPAQRAASLYLQSCYWQFVL